MTTQDIGPREVRALTLGRAVKSGPTFLEQNLPISNVLERLFLNFDFY